MADFTAHRNNSVFVSGACGVHDLPDDERARAIAELLAFEESRLRPPSQEGELGLLIAEAMPAIRNEFIAAIRAGKREPLWPLVWDAERDLDTIQHILNLNYAKDDPEAELLQGAHLWRVWADDAFDRHDRRWVNSNGRWRPPVETHGVGRALECYRENNLIRQPYVSWALANAYLLATGLEIRLRLQDDFASLLVDSGVTLADERGEMSAAASGHFLYLYIMGRELYELTAIREMISGNLDVPVKERLLAAIIGLSGFWHSLLSGTITSVATLTIYVAMQRWRRRRIRAASTEFVGLLGKRGPILRACKKAWKCANSPVVNVAELRMRVDDLADAMGQDESPIRWLVDDAADRWGADLNVSHYLDYSVGVSEFQ